MARSLKKFREIVFQLLYSCNFESSEKEGAMSLIMRQNAVPKSTMRDAMEKVEAICLCQKELETLLEESASDYELGRIPYVERTILLLGLFELFHTDLPPKVVIAEAIRLAKKYATTEGASFVNALLDRLYKEKEGAENLREKQAAK